MGTGSYVVRGLGNEQSLDSASHGAGRRMSRGQAKRTFTTDDLARQTAGVECRKDAGVVDEIPGAYTCHGSVSPSGVAVSVMVSSAPSVRSRARRRV
jgi:tRNA-splicing ligase RtcB